MKGSSYLLSVPSRLPSRHQELWNLPSGSSPSLSTLFSPRSPELRLWSRSLLRRTCHWDSDLTLFFAPWPSPCPLTSSQGHRVQPKSLTSSRAPPSGLLEGMRLNRCKAFIGAWHMVDNHCLQISFLRSGNLELVSTELYWLLWLSTAIQEWYFRHELFWYYWLNL